MSGGGVDSAGVVLRERSSRNVHIHMGIPPPPVFIPLLPTPGMDCISSVSVTTKPESCAFCSSCSGITCGNTSGAHH